MVMTWGLFLCWIPVLLPLLSNADIILKWHNWHSSERGVTTFSSEAFALDIIALIKADNMSIYLTFPSRLEDFIFNDVKCEV